MSESHKSIKLNGRTLPYRIRRSARARYVRLTIEAGNGLMVVVPRGFRLREVPGILREKAAWILRHLDRVAEQEQQRDAALRDGRAVLYRGTPHRLRIVTTGNGALRSRVIPERGFLFVQLAPVHAGQPRVVLEAWFRLQARDILTERTEELAHRLGFRLRRISIRNQKTRWGSCSSRGNISLNWRLVLVPPQVMDYVIIHELVHLEVPNHSRDFYRRLAELCPDFKRHRTWLKEHAQSLNF